MPTSGQALHHHLAHPARYNRSLLSTDKVDGSTESLKVRDIHRLDLPQTPQSY